jgi:hypothetical protein
MPIIEVFIAKLIAMSLAFVAQYILWKKYASFQTWLTQNQIGVVSALVVLTRIIPFILVFVILKEEPRGDVPFFITKPLTQCISIWSIVTFGHFMPLFFLILLPYLY